MSLWQKFIPNRWTNFARATVFPFYGASSKRQFVLIYFARLLFLVGRRLWIDHCPRQAAALAFQTMLSLVPLVAVVVAVGSALKLEFFRDRLFAFLEARLLPDAASEVGLRVLELAEGIHYKTLGVAGGITLVIIAITLLFNIEQVLSEIFRAKRSRRLWTRFLTALALLIFAPIALGLSLYFTTDLLRLPRLVYAGLPFLFTLCALFLAYLLLPHARIRVKHAFIAAFVAGVLFESVKIGFAFYVKHLGATLSYLYGALTILPLSMVWIYLAWLIFLFGAELAASLHEVKHHGAFDKTSDKTERVVEIGD
jgi:membrane protein